MRNKIEQVSKEHSILEVYPKIDVSAGPAPFIAGLDVLYKYGCPLCMYTAGKTRVRDHLKDTHQRQDLSALENIPCQILHIGAAPTNVRIVPPTVQPPSDSEDQELEDDFRAYDVNSPVVLSAPNDNRLISPWLMRTGFHKYVDGLPVPELVKLCAMPLESETKLSTLHSLVVQYMEDATALIARTDPLVLQMLNTNEPQKV